MTGGGTAQLGLIARVRLVTASAERLSAFYADVSKDRLYTFAAATALGVIFVVTTVLVMILWGRQYRRFGN